MKELFFYILGAFSGIFLMCCLQVTKKDQDKKETQDKKADI